jgi:ubiquinone/menaquinone biosynthesis C-methylase UbiE
MDCDRLARIYRWLEYLRYGKALERCRATMLPQIAQARRVLILGDGDGRFSTAFLAHNQTARVASLEISGQMIAVARRRLNAASHRGSSRITFRQDDIRTTPQPGDGYDLVVTHFFFDVFSTSELRAIIDRVSRWTTPDALWLVSEFDLPSSGWHRTHARFWLKTMYTFFRITTNLRNQHLPDWRPLMEEAGFIARKQTQYQNGFIVSELWQRSA